LVETIVFISSVLLAYLIGSFPTSFIMARMTKGIDIRQVGSGNAGATNVLRSVGKLQALITLIVDVGKGILAVTVLTSFGQEDMQEILGAPANIEDLVYLRARRALDLGCDGVVSSGLEAKRLRNELGERFLVVTPGIRPGINRELNLDDQKRIVTARGAIENGADHIVVGRPISTAPDPIAMVTSMQREIREALSK